MDRRYYRVAPDSPIYAGFEAFKAQYVKFREACAAFEIKHGAQRCWLGSFGVIGLQFDGEVPAHFRPYHKSHAEISVPRKSTLAGKEAAKEMDNLPYQPDGFSFANCLEEAAGGDWTLWVGSTFYTPMFNVDDADGGFYISIPAGLNVPLPGCEEVLGSVYAAASEKKAEPVEEEIAA